MDGPIRPRWQIDDCPPWCARAHAEDDFPDDRRHESRGLEFPAIALFQSYKGDDRIEQVESMDMVAVLSRRDGRTATWLYLGEEEGVRQRLEISIESARRLHEQLSALLIETGY